MIKGDMTPEERARIEQELRDNGYVTIDDVPFSVKQLALLNYHKLVEIAASFEKVSEGLATDIKEVRDVVLQLPGKYTTKNDLEKFKASMRTTTALLTTALLGVLGLFVTLLVQ